MATATPPASSAPTVLVPAARLPVVGDSVLRQMRNWVVFAAASWWLLGQLAGVLRPMLVAVLLAYILLPSYRWLRTRMHAGLAVGLIAGATTLVLAGLASAVYASLVSFRDELPRFQSTASVRIERGLDRLNAAVPAWLHRESSRPVEEQIGPLLASGTREALSAAGAGLVEVLTAGLYLLFILLESDRFAARVRGHYPGERGLLLLDVAGRINAAVMRYLKAKVLSSLALAVPAWLVLTVMGVRFAILWALLTFLCNFIPYLGSAVAYALPVGFAFLQMELGVRPVAGTALLLLLHVASATVVEPMILGRAVGLSPLVILTALAIWGLLWGLPGMLLAVPLTMVLKLVAENLPRGTAPC